MKYINRIYLIVEPRDKFYPNYNNNPIVHITETNPVNSSYNNPYLSSPLFSVSDSINTKPVIDDNTVITFCIIPKPFPVIKTIVDQFDLTDEIWFSIGLANVILFSKKNELGKTKKIINFLKENKYIIASEEWLIKENSIDNSTTNHYSEIPEEIKFSTKLSDKLSAFNSFSISEFIISANRLLSISKIFTPHYYEKHHAFLKASYLLVNDMSFLSGDFEFSPSDQLISFALRRKHFEGKISKKDIYDAVSESDKESYINNRGNRLVHINSTISYVYNQIYSGTFPLFDHIGIIKYHSLLGIGSAVGSIYELMVTLDDIFIKIPFENINNDFVYNKSETSISIYKNSLTSPAHHEVTQWITDNTRTTIINNFNLSSHKRNDEEYFNRLSFYSGRLGFREYQLTATAGIQVLISARTLEWNVINYTHEIIHNHVRIILDKILNSNERKNNREKWCDNYLDIIKKTIKEKSFENFDIKYLDLIRVILLKYCIDSKYFGSLTEKWSPDSFNEHNSTIRYKLPTASALNIKINKLYKGISEIFVHIIDFSYVYNRNIKVYLKSIWSSWACTPVVSQDIEQYILRTLLIISVTIEGNSKYRFKESINKFVEIIDEIISEGKNYQVFNKIKEKLNKSSKSEIKHRFNNSLRVADLVNSFFIIKLEDYLDNEDDLYSTNSDNDLNIFYDLDINEFKKCSIKSKIRFVFDQLNRTVNESKKTSLETDTVEKQSAWLLLALSTLNR